MEKLIEWLISNNTNGTWVLVLVSIIVIFLMIYLLIIIMQGRELIIGPIKIGPRPTQPKTSLINIPSTKVEIKKIQEPLLIRYSDRNRLTIPSNFLLWDKCTILLWIWVPPKGADLRDTSDFSRFILAHHTGVLESERYKYHNQFCFRYSMDKRWELQFSNNHAEYPSERLNISDGLETGWHHFMIVWDKTEPKFELIIDMESKGSARLADFLGNWPEKTSGIVSVGSWVTHENYCNTKLFMLQIISNSLLPGDGRVIDHFSKKPL